MADPGAPPGLALGRLALRGEKDVLRVPASRMLRLRATPSTRTSCAGSKRCSSGVARARDRRGRAPSDACSGARGAIA